MKIALLGYGKAGKTIEQIALKRGHEIILKIDNDHADYDITQADVAIEFSTPNSAFANISNSLRHRVPTVAGTTGWLAHYDEAVALCKARDTAFLYAPNLSVGVNIFFVLNQILAKLMASLNDYHISIEEIHHTQKLDVPSGTATTLAEGVIAEIDKSAWQLGTTADENIIPIEAKRIGNTSGTHIVTYSSDIDTIEIKHIAHDRNGFALGAIIAAEWLLNKKGIYSMKDVLNLK